MAKASASDDWSHVKLVKTGRRMLVEKTNARRFNTRSESYFVAFSFYWRIVRILCSKGRGVLRIKNC